MYNYDREKNRKFFHAFLNGHGMAHSLFLESATFEVREIKQIYLQSMNVYMWIVFNEEKLGLHSSFKIWSV